MSRFASTLKKMRLNAGYKTAKAFYEVIKNEGDTGFNYTYYSRIEKGDALPSHKVVSVLGKFFDKLDREELIKSFCSELFPECDYLFEGQGSYDSPPPSEASSPTSSTQSELTLKQVAAIVATPENYYVFLMSTLARRPFTFQEMNEFFAKSKVEASVKALLENKLLIQEGDTFRASSIEARFPKPYNDMLKDAYRKMDDWDEEFSVIFDLNDLVRKVFIRRVSYRYLGLIKNSLNNVFDLIRASDELDSRYNNKVIQFSVTVNEGEIPG